jgi:hypothetical protein
VNPSTPCTENEFEILKARALATRIEARRLRLFLCRADPSRRFGRDFAVETRMLDEKRAGRWTPAELEKLGQEANEKSPRELALLLDRTYDAVRQKHGDIRFRKNEWAAS